MKVRSTILNVEPLVQPLGNAFVLQLHLEVVESPFLSAFSTSFLETFSAD